MNFSHADPYVDSVASFLAVLFIHGLLFRLIRERKPNWIEIPRKRHILALCVGLYYGLWGVFFIYRGEITHNAVIYINLRMNILLVTSVFFGRIAVSTSFIVIVIGRLIIGNSYLSDIRYIMILAAFYTICMIVAHFKISALKKYFFIIICALPALSLYYFTNFNTHRVLSAKEGIFYAWTFFFSSVVIFFAASYIRQSNEALVELKDTATNDQLTRLKNARYFDNRYARAFDRAVLLKENLSLLLLDIDHFKTINDEYGHQAGNLVLAEFGMLLRNHTLPSGAVIARVGGEEFAVLLPGVSDKKAEQIAESLCREVYQSVFPHQPKKHSVSVSIGVSSLYHARKQLFATKENLYETADLLLYQSKEKGRNQVSAGQLLEKGNFDD